MLEAIRKSSRSTIIYLFFAVIIVVFVVNFGPGARMGGRGHGETFAAKETGYFGQSVWEVGDHEFRMAYITRGGMYVSPKLAKQFHLKESTMDQLIERELFAQEAERLGFTVSTQEVEDMVADGYMYVKGQKERSEEFFADGHFDYKQFQEVCENRLGLTVAAFIDSQRRDMEADKFKQLLLGSVKVTPGEALADYKQRETQVNLDFVRFSPHAFEAQVHPTAQEIADYRKAHADEIQKYYEQHDYLYKKQDKQARLRRILIQVPKPTADQLKQEADAAKAADEAQAKAQAKVEAKKDAKAGAKANKDKASQKDSKAEAKAGDQKSGAKKAPKLVEDSKTAAARHKLERALRQIQGGEDFAKVAEKINEDADTKATDGLGGWVKKDDAHLGPVLESKVFLTGKVGDVIGPALTERGMELIKIEGLRQGDFTLDQVADEIAAKKLVEEKTKKLAEDEAKVAAAKARGEGVSLADQYPKPTDAELKDTSGTSHGELHVEQTQPFPRHGDLVPQIGVSAALVNQAFNLKKGEVAGPFEVSGSYVVVQLEERKEPDMDFYEKHKAAQLRSLEQQKWADLLDNWSKERCIEVRDAGKLHVNQSLLQYEGVDDATPVNYQPCSGERSPF